MSNSWDVVHEFDPLGVVAFTTTRADGDFGIPLDGPTHDVRAKWESLAPAIGAERVASARQVHGTKVVAHADDWAGWRRIEGVDGHVTAVRGTALAVTVADCVPVFLAHPTGVIGILHAGWRGVVAGTLAAGVDAMRALGADTDDLRVHLGPSISGRNYEVGTDVYKQLTGWDTVHKRRVDLRALLAEQARALGVRHLSASLFCTYGDADRFFSHRRGDPQRQIAVIALR